jgi:hypothetical protein
MRYLTQKSMHMARMLLWLVGVAGTRRVKTYLVNRPELILYDISVIITESVLYMNVKPCSTADTIP